MNELIITIFITNMIILSINISKYIENLITNIIYIKASEKTKKEQEKEIKRLKELNTMYVNKINEMYQENNKIKKEIKKDMPF